MRVFHSELSANPALYSFGYSVYGEIEESDSLDEVYEKGFLPFVGAKKQSKNLVYMTRGTRVTVSEFVERHHHARIRRKVAALGIITSKLHTIESFPVTDEFISFLRSYFTFRFGKDSMPEERIRAILDSGFVTHIREFRIGNEVAAYVLEVQGKSFVHTWYHAYAKKFEGSYLGLYLYLEILKELQQQKISYLYLGVTYGTWMSYKTHFQPLSFWNGQEWIDDPKSTKLKELLKADSLRLITTTDPWRDSLVPFYTGLYSYGSTKLEFRLLSTIVSGLPRITLLILSGIGIAMIAILLQIFGIL
jgi:hypothetical protein